MTDPVLWRDWVVLALADAPEGELGSDAAVIEEVAIRFADRFDQSDRNYVGEQPIWHTAVRDALKELRSDRLVRQQTGVLTAKGRKTVDEARQRCMRKWQQRVEETPAADEPTPLLTPGVIAPPLRTHADRTKVGFPDDDDKPGLVMAELNLRYAAGAAKAFARLENLWGRVTHSSGEPNRTPTRLAEEYATGRLSINEMKRLVSADASVLVRSGRSLRRLWPDFPVSNQVDGSCVTVKADAARRAFNASGDRIVWAVIDSGVWADHPHFAEYNTLRHESVKDLHRLFPLEGEPSENPELALSDESGHGTHVAGIIAGTVESWRAKAGRTVRVTESRFNVENPTEPLRMPRTVEDYSLLAGMAPKTKLVSLKVLHASGTEDARVARIIKALAYVRKVNGESTDSMRIHGVNLSVGYEFDPQWFACGQSPLCREVDKLVRTGVVVVVAAGNSGYGSLAVAAKEAPRKFGLGMTINDPGNAELAITVGSTHRDSPHGYGVSYFSSKGPTGDGRAKPDLVAPGERITSCAAGKNLAAVVAGDVPADTAVYVEETGTSMAAPHVSGAIAALLSVRREFIGRPDRVKQIILDAATPLGRSTDFEGAGLLDLMRALQSV